MVTDKLFDKILLEPAAEGANHLCVVSGYATAAMAFHHLQQLRERTLDVHVDLLVGMTPRDGISESNHQGFNTLVSEQSPPAFVCSYLAAGPATHAKVYVWLRDRAPVAGFVGSANYTQQAFCLRSQQEAMERCDPQEAFEYFSKLQTRAIYCTHAEAEDLIAVFNDRYVDQARRFGEQVPAPEVEGEPALLRGLEHVRVSLLDARGRLPGRSGLNWGQRPEERREPNQAYIRLPAQVYRTSFFPPRGVHFTVLTDDRKVLICTRAQDNGKAVHTPHNNSLIGEYFRHRIGLASGEKVKLEDLQRYGRTHVDFYKIDDETYWMDFSVR